MTDTSCTYPAAPPVPSSTPAVPDRHVRRSATFWGIMLIVLGAAFLLAQFVPAVSWWMLWPLVIVVAGVAQMVSPERDGSWTVDRVFEGLGTVVLGAVLLGNTTGYVEWTVWLTFLSFWPVLLIALGVTIVGRGVGQTWLRICARLLVLATLGLAVYLSLTGAALGVVDRGGAVISIPGAGAGGQTLNITIEPGDVPSIRTW
jgi:hypothetical protein